MSRPENRILPHQFLWESRRLSSVVQRCVVCDDGGAEEVLELPDDDGEWGFGGLFTD